VDIGGAFRVHIQFVVKSGTPDGIIDNGERRPFRTWHFCIGNSRIIFFIKNKPGPHQWHHLIGGMLPVILMRIYLKVHADFSLSLR
jgi:hypothetical protein